MLIKDVSILEQNFAIKNNCYVGIADSTIAYIGEEMPPKDYGEVIEGRNKLMIPGFYNAHAHTPMTLLRGYAENMKLQDWLQLKIFPFEAHLTPQAVYYATLLGIAEMFRSGTVAATDMYMFGDEMAKAYITAGAKLNLSIGTTCFDGGGYYALKDYALNEELFSQYHGANQGRIQIDMSIHAEYTSNPQVVAEVAEYGKQKNCRMQVHLSESKTEHEQCLQRHGKTPARYFYDLGLFDLPTTAAHCVWLEKEDLKLLQAKGVTVAHCPISNLKLGSGIADIPAMLKAGVKVALGSDGAASNNSLSMIEEMKLFAILHKGEQRDSKLISPSEALFAATRSGALSQGREDCGLIKEKMKADFVLIDLDQPRYYPRCHLLNHLVYAGEGSDVYLTAVEGKIVYRHGEYLSLDLEKIMFEVERHYCKISNKI